VSTSVCELPWKELYESQWFQVWIVGGVCKVVEMTTDSHVYVGAMHPALLQVVRGQAKCITRGYPLASFTMPSFDELNHRACEVVSLVSARTVAATFRAHDLQLVADKHWLWSVDETLLAGGPSFDFLTAVAIHSDQRGSARQSLFQSLGARLHRHEWRPAVDPHALAEPLLSVHENMPDFNKFDTNGYIWGRPGHFPLWVTIGDQRMRSQAAIEQKHVKDNKKAVWNATGIWPWWIFHESELQYWLAHNGSDNSRGYSGHQHHPGYLWPGLLACLTVCLNVAKLFVCCLLCNLFVQPPVFDFPLSLALSNVDTLRGPID
jgi:hypothetical protein